MNLFNEEVLQALKDAALRWPLVERSEHGRLLIREIVNGYVIALWWNVEWEQFTVTNARSGEPPFYTAQYVNVYPAGQVIEAYRETKRIMEASNNAFPAHSSHEDRAKPSTSD